MKHIPALAAEFAALAEVEETLGAIAALLGQPQYLHAVFTPEGKVALVTTTNPGIYAKVLGTPEEAVAAAHVAYLKAGVKVHGTAG